MAFRDSGSRFRVPGLGSEISGLGLRVSSDFGFRDSGFGFRAPDLRSRGSGSEFGVHSDGLDRAQSLSLHDPIHPQL